MRSSCDRIGCRSNVWMLPGEACRSHAIYIFTWLILFPMPKKDRSMTGNEIEELLGKAKIGRLGFSGDDYPYVVPLSFCLMDGKIYFHGAFKGKKIELLKKDKRVCFEVDTGHPIKPEKSGDCSYSYRSVIACGEARLVEKHEKELFLAAGRALYEKYVVSHVPELEESLIKKTQFVEITIREVTGKKSADLCGDEDSRAERG